MGETDSTRYLDRPCENITGNISHLEQHVCSKTSFQKDHHPVPVLICSGKSPETNKKTLNPLKNSRLDDAVLNDFIRLTTQRNWLAEKDQLNATWFHSKVFTVTTFFFPLFVQRRRNVQSYFSKTGLSFKHLVILIVPILAGEITGLCVLSTFGRA